MYTTPRIALAMFIMAFVGVVRGLWGSKKKNRKLIMTNDPFQTRWLNTIGVDILSFYILELSAQKSRIAIR